MVRTNDALLARIVRPASAPKEPHPLWPVSYLHVTVLARVLPAPITKELTAALFAPPSSGWSLWTIPGGLAALTSTQPLADDWQQAMHSDPNLDPEDLQPVDWITALWKIARFAVSDDEGLFLYDGPKPHE
jgi:hypothetical protein